MKKMNERSRALFKRENLFSGATTALFLAFAIVINLIVYVITTAFGLYLSTPNQVDLSLSGYTESLFAEAEAEAKETGEKVKIIFCQSPEEMDASDKGSLVHETAKNFVELHPDFIEIQYLNIITKVLSSADGSKTEYVDLGDYQTETVIDGKTVKSPIYKTSVIFKSSYGKRVLTDTYSSEGYSGFYTVNSSGYAIAYNGEEIIASMIMWSLTPTHKTAYFTVYHSEVSDVAFSNMLVCAGYNVKTIDLKKEEIPADAGLVVISSPKEDFERAQAGSNIDTEIERLRTYVENGGNLYVALDPYVERLTVLEEFLAEYGIETSYATIPERGEIRNIIRDANASIETDFYTMEINYADNELARKIHETVKKYSDTRVLIKDCSALKLSKNATSLLKTSPSAALYAGGGETDGAGSYDVAAIATHTGPTGKTGTVFVVPSVYLTASDGMVSGGYSNRLFLYSLFENMHGLENLPYGCKTVYYSDSILEGLTMQTARIYTAIVLSVPVILSIIGGVIIIRRKNR